MYVRLSDTVFVFSGHAKWGKPVEAPAAIPDGVLPTEFMKLSYPPMEWPNTNRNCGGLSRVAFRFNGMDRQAWICEKYLDHDKLGSHGDAYARIINGTWSTLENEPELDLCWGRVGYVPRSVHKFEELVMSWGFSSEMINTIPTSRFIELTRMGRGAGSRRWAEHCTVLLRCIGIEPGSSPTEKASKVFGQTKNISELLKVMANEKQYGEQKQAQHYTRWNQPIKSTSTIC